MEPSPTTLKRRRLSVLLVLLGCALGGLLLLTHSGLLGRLSPSALMSRIQAAGPWWFFGAMTVLPALGFPVAAFNFAAAPAFAATWGLGTVLAAASLALLCNVTLAYGLSRYLLRPPIERGLAWLGYRLPEIPAGKHRLVIFLLRIMPGPPFFIQSFLLGLARVPFIPYLLISWSVASLYAALAVLGGQALFTKDVKLGLFALAGVGVIAIGLKWLRRRLHSTEITKP